jgi:cell division protein FtsB
MLKVGLAFVTSALLLNALAGSRGLPAVLQAKRDRMRQQEDLERLKSDNAQLRHQIVRLRDDPTAIEDAARRDLFYISPGEKVFIIRDVPPADARPVDPPASKPADAPPAP